MLEYDVAIIGAGPAGIMAAIACLRNTCSVILLEKNSRPGLKLLLTGGGRCNITNLKPVRELLTFYNNPNFLKHSFYSFTNEDLLSLFEDKGLSFNVEDNDRVFPKTNKSVDVLNILLDYIDDSVIRYNFEVKSISDDFIINGEIKAKKIIIATGGITYPQTGTSPDNYFLTSQPITSIKYGLVPLITDCDVFDISGVMLENVGITYKNKIRQNLLFSHVGISGPGILDISNEISESTDYNAIFENPHLDLKISIDLLPDISHDELSEKFIIDFQKNGKTYLKNYLKHFMPYSFLKFFLRQINIDGDVRLSQISRKNKNKLLANIKNFPITVAGFNHELAKITVGGVDVKYVNSKTLESKVIANLYFAGEVLNLHGPSGGYNLKLAFSTGYLAGLSASKL